MRTSGIVDPALGRSGDLDSALARAGEDERVRNEIMEALRNAEARADDPTAFRLEVRWPLILAMLAKAGTHRMRLANGLVFEVGPDSWIEQAFLATKDPDLLTRLGLRTVTEVSPKLVVDRDPTLHHPVGGF